MANNRTMGIILLVVGVILLYFGFQASESLGDQVHQTLTGRFTDSTMWYVIFGAAATIAGAALLMRKR